MPALLFDDSLSDSSDEYPIYARSGWRIPQGHPPARTVEQMRIKAGELMKLRPGIKLRSLSPYPYDCVGMIFACRRAWIDIDYIYTILKEDGFIRIPRHAVRQGDIVLYKNRADDEPTHVALIVMIERYGEAQNIQVISKWGQEAEFIHFVEDVPGLFGEPVEFYTDRTG
jgi:hypothetical protein